MTAGASKAAAIIKQPALAPSPQPRPAPTARALPPKLVDQRGPFWVPIRGPIPTPIDTHLGRSNYFLMSIGVFTLSSALCGLASSLRQLILFRIIQGLAG